MSSTPVEKECYFFTMSSILNYTLDQKNIKNPCAHLRTLPDALQFSVVLKQERAKKTTKDKKWQSSGKNEVMKPRYDGLRLDETENGQINIVRKKVDHRMHKDCISE